MGLHLMNQLNYTVLQEVVEIWMEAALEPFVVAFYGKRQAAYDNFWAYFCLPKTKALWPWSHILSSQ